MKKFSDNTLRDKDVREHLNNQGIKVVVIWECTVKKIRKDKQYEQNIISAVEGFLRNNDMYYEI